MQTRALKDDPTMETMLMMRYKVAWVLLVTQIDPEYRFEIDRQYSQSHLICIDQN